MGSLSPGLPGCAPRWKHIWMAKQYVCCWLTEERDLISPEISKQTHSLLSCWHFLQSNWQVIFPSETLSSWPSSCRTDIYPSRVRQRDSPWVLSQNQISETNPKTIFQIERRGCCQKPSIAFLGGSKAEMQAWVCRQFDANPRLK